MYDLKLMGNRIKQVRKEKGMTLDDVARRIRVAKSTVQRYEAARISTPKEPVIDAIASALGVSCDWIRGISSDRGSDTVNNGKIRIPVLGGVSAGGGVFAGGGEFADGDIIDYEYVDADTVKGGKNYVFLKVVGDSMYPEFKEGDMVFVEACPEVESGTYAVVMVDSDMGVIKRIVLGEGFVELQSVNPMYPPRRFNGEETKRVRVFGRVKGMKREY